MMIELVVKHGMIILLFLGLYRPLRAAHMAGMPLEAHESVISLMGFLMAAGIIGAFELSYARTNLGDRAQRYLAHFTKFMLYSSILLLMDIAVAAMRPSGDDLSQTMIMASTPIAISLVLYDFWDGLRAVDHRR
jgi:hypothetical protein